MLAVASAFAPSFAMQSPVATTGLRASAPSMLIDETGRFPAKGKGKAIPFLAVPAHLDGTMAGDNGFDPLELGSAYSIKWMREAELKHGRVCMLAFFGWVAVDGGNTWPGAPAVSSLAAHDEAVKNGSMLFLLGVIGVFEVRSPVHAGPTTREGENRERGAGVREGGNRTCNITHLLHLDDVRRRSATLRSPRC
tara:strand:+ start:567 stop:1148 length:582 start_codon:yes stop_codon:yes gene_type:complete